MTAVPGPPAPAPSSVERAALIDQMGGMRGLVDSGLPALIFVTINILVGLRPAVISAVAIGVAVFGLRLVRREPVQQVVTGFVGLAIAAFIAIRSGRAEGFFLPGIVQNYVVGAALLISVAVRRPLVGVAVAAFEGRAGTWRDDPAVRRIYANATLGWAVYMLARASAGLALYGVESSVGLLILRLGGFPMILLGAALTVAYTRKATRALPPQPPTAPDRAAEG